MARRDLMDQEYEEVTWLILMIIVLIFGYSLSSKWDAQAEKEAQCIRDGLQYDPAKHECVVKK